MGKKLVFVDTGLDINQAKKFRKTMEEKFNSNETILIITHSNRDHYMAVEAYDGIPLTVSEEFIERIKRTSPGKQVIFHNASLFREEVSFNSPDGKLTFRLTGGHTSDSSYGYYQQDKILIAGDNLLSGMPQHFFQEDPDLDNWITCLKKWEMMDIDKIVPGHGKLTDKSYVTRVRSYFEKLRKILSESKEEGLKIDEVLERSDLPPYFEKDPDKWVVAGIRQVYNKMCENE
jgi:glyoxylase-like metal-dependent hydrolase (beta-lactamase superfamily II)